MPLMDPGDGAPSDADPPVVPAAVDDLDRELDRLLADNVILGVVPDTRERLERLADELFALVRARLERSLTLACGLEELVESSPLTRSTTSSK